MLFIKSLRRTSNIQYYDIQCAAERTIRLVNPTLAYSKVDQKSLFIMTSYIANITDKIIYAFTVPNRKLFIDEKSGYISENTSEIRVAYILKVITIILLLLITFVSVILNQFSNGDQSYEQISKNMVGFLYFYHFPKTYILSMVTPKISVAFYLSTLL